MASEVDFTDDEIREELAHLGYYNVPQEKLEDFKRDLVKLISSERSRTSSLNTSNLTDENPEGDKRCYNLPKDKDDDEDVEDNLTNHGNQWIDQKGFKEDWHYKGEKSKSSRPQTAPVRQSKSSRGKYDYDGYQFSNIYGERNQNRCDAESDSDCDQKFIKRKTSRKTSDGCRMIDESFTTDTDSDAGGIYEIYEKIKKLAMRECECGKSRPKSGDIEPPYRIKGKVKNPSVIKCKEPPHTRNLVKTSRAERLQMYEKHWKIQPAVGENHRHALRKAVRARLMQQFDVQKPQKVYVPNLYVPPHLKCRVNLRWNVRRALKSYEMPKHGFYHEI